MTGFRHRMTRRSFLAASAFAPFSVLGSRSDVSPHRYQYDHVIGTSLDLVVWASDVGLADTARDAILGEILRLSSVLNTRDPDSEISVLGEASGPIRSRDLSQVLAAYDHWERRTAGLLSIHPAGPGSPRNVDALGKAYIIDRAVEAAKLAAPGAQGLLNIGGDIVLWGRAEEVAIADPASPQDNAPPLARVSFRDGAIATSGTYARGAHLLDGRTGQPVGRGVSSTVVARNAVIANALATTLCVTGAGEGLRLVESTPGAEALRVDANGLVQRTSGFARLERPIALRTALPADWPTGFELTIALTIKEGQPAGGRGGGRGGFGGPGGPGGFGGRGFLKRPYVAVWVENTAGKLVRVLAFWADKPRYYTELSSFFTVAGRNQNVLYSMARATRSPGSYQLLWDGLDEQHKPVPSGSYTIVVETNQEHGTYAKQDGAIDCAQAPATLSLPATANFEAVTIQYGPKQNRA
jgi:thiamine biosynthesis lipoprotein